MLSQELIEKALGLTDKDIGYVSFDDSIHWYKYLEWLFLAYLLTEDFCIKYQRDVTPAHIYMVSFERLIGEAIYEYQKWNESPLIELLSKI